ncbi:MAG: stage III sporulation protein SpoIIIAB [Halanaerobacter sp.]
MKLIGAILIIISSSSLGFLIAHQIALRPKQLQEMKTALEMLKTEIDYGMTPLPEAFAKLASNLNSPIADFFAIAQKRLEAGGVAQEVWQESVSEVSSKTALLEKDEELLVEIGYNLGSTSSADQIRHLDLAQEKISNLYYEAVEEKEQKVKLWRYLGVLGGLLVVIIIV